MSCRKNSTAEKKDKMDDSEQPSTHLVTSECVAVTNLLYQVEEWALELPDLRKAWVTGWWRKGEERGSLPMTEKQSASVRNQGKGISPQS